MQEKVEYLEAQASQVDALKAKCKKLVDENTKLAEQAKQTTGLIAEKKASEIILQEAKNLNKVLETNVKKLSEEHVSLKNKYSEMEGGMEKQVTEINRLKAMLKTIQEEPSENVEENEGSKDSEATVPDGEVYSLKEKLTASENKLQETINTCKAKEEEYCAQIVQLQGEMDSLTRENSSVVASLNAQNEEYCTKLKKCDEDIETLREELNQQKEEAEQEKFALAEKYTELESKLEKGDALCQEESSKLALVTEENQELSLQLSNLKDKLLTLEANNTAQSEELVKTVKDLDLVKEEMAAANHIVEVSIKEKEILQNSLDSLQSDLKNTQNQLAAYDTNSKNNESELNIAMKALQEELQSCKLELENEKSNISVIKKSKEDSEKELQALIDEKDVAIEKHVEAMRNGFKGLFKFDGLSFVKKISEGISFPNEFESVTDNFSFVSKLIDAIELDYSKNEALNENERKSLSSKISEISSEKNSLEEQILGLKKSLADAQNCANDISEMKKNFDALKEENESLKDSVSTAYNQLEGSKSQNELLQSNLVTKESEITELKLNIDKLNSNNKELSCLLDESKESFEKMQETVSDQQSLDEEILIRDKKCQNLTEQLAESEKLLQEARGNEKEFKVTVENLSDQVQELNETVTNLMDSESKLKEEEESLRAKVVQLESDVAGYVSENDALKTRISELDALTKNSSTEHCQVVEEFTKKCSDYANEITKLESLIQEANEKSSEQDAHAISQMDEMNRSQQQLNSKISELQDTAKTIEEEKETLLQQLNAAKEELLTNGQKLADAEREIAELTSSKELLARNNEDQLSEKELLQERLNSLEKEKDEAIEKVNSLSEQNSCISSEVAELKNKYQDLQDSASQEENNLVCELKRQKEELNEALKASEKEKHECLTKISALEQELSEIQSRVEGFEKEKNCLTESLDAMKSKFEQTETEKEKLTEQINGLNITSERCLHELQLKSDECKALEEEKNALEINLSSVKEDLLKVNTDMGNLKTENEELSSQLTVSFKIVAPVIYLFALKNSLPI